MQPNVQRFLLNAKFLSNASKFDQSDEECISYSYVTILLMNIYGFRSWLSERTVSSYLYEASYLQSNAIPGGKMQSIVTSRGCLLRVLPQK